MFQNRSARPRTLTVRVALTPQQAEHLAQYLQRTTRQYASPDEQRAMQLVADQVRRALVSDSLRASPHPR